MHIVNSCLSIGSITVLLLGCASLAHHKHQPMETTRMECDILAREKSLAHAIQLGDKDAYIEHLTNQQHSHRQDEEHLDKTISELHQKAIASSSGTFDRYGFEVRHYYGPIKLNRNKTVAHVSYGFGIARCLMCRAIQFDDITTVKAEWRLENDGRWRRYSNKIGPSISRFEFKNNQTQCTGLQNERL
jgi:hypothetical protein